MKTMLPLIVALQAVSVLADDVVWTNSIANTPDTAYEWNVAGNWKDAHAGAAGDYVTLSPSSKVYIKADPSAPPSQIVGNGKAVILGGITLRQMPAKNANLGNASVYGDVIFDITDENNSSTRQSYVNGGANICGRPISLTDNYVCRVALSSGSVNFRFDRYADTAGVKRTDDLAQLLHMGIGNGTATFYAPAGADAVSGTWNLVEGSTYATLASGQDTHALAVGTIVSSPGYLDDGTYLKRVFDDSTIELSAPAKDTGAATLSFAAFNPDFTATFKNTFYFQGATPSVRVIKSRVEDSARVVFNEINSSYSKGETSFGSDSSSIVHGTIEVRKFSGSWTYGLLRNVYLELAANASASASLPFRISGSSSVARLTVTNNLSSSIACLTNFNGTLVKDGMGTLSVGLCDAANAGSVKVSQGTLALVKNVSVGDAALSVRGLALEDGATLLLPEDGLDVAMLAVTGTVTVSGGKVRVAAGADRSSVDLSNVTFTDGGGVTFKLVSGKECDSLVSSLGEGAVVGHPAFWVDASKLDSIVYTTENGTNYVTRWNDCREGEPMFCTNLVIRPTLWCGEKMSSKYVKIARHPNATNYYDTEQLVWSEPIRGIKAVFLVQDPTDGGGTILGRCSWRLPCELYANSWGGPFYRENSSLTDSAIVTDVSSTIPAVRYGRYYLNGREVVGRETGYLGKYMQIVEFHANTSYDASTGVVDCDAFGGGYRNDKDQLKQCNGCMRIGEYIIYTNSLSYAERVSVAQYLSKKWFDHDIYYIPVDPDYTHDAEENFREEGVELDVVDGQVATIEQTASGTLSKTGGGRLYMKGLDGGASLNVEEGSVTLLANTLRRYVPNDSWIHVDAQAVDTVKTTTGDVLDKWYDVNGTGESFRNDNFTAKAKLVQNAIGDYPAVDIGPPGKDSSTSAALVYYDRHGVVSENYDQLPTPYQHYAVMGAPLIRTAFAVYNSEAGGGSIFGGRGGGFPQKGLPHQHSQGDDSPIIDAPGYINGQGLPALSNAIANGSAVFRRNGESADPFAAKFLKGNERVTFAYPAGRKMAQLGIYGQSGQYRGGLKYGEVIMFEGLLTAVEIASVEAYLAKRWFGIDTPGYGSAAGAVKVNVGTSLTILGDDFSATSLGGGGTVTGDVELAGGGTLLAVVSSDGSVQTLSVTGTAKVNGGTVTLAGDVGAIKPGSYAILHADTLQDGGGTWIAPAKTSRNIFIVTLTDDSIYLNVLEKGLRITFR